MGYRLEFNLKKCLSKYAKTLKKLFADYPILGKITVNQVQKCGLHMLVGYIPNLIQAKNEVQCI